MLRHYYLLPAPNFGKTFGPSVTSGQSWAFEKASSLSEIGRRERTPKQGVGGGMKSEILQVISVSPMQDRAMALAH